MLLPRTPAPHCHMLISAWRGDSAPRQAWQAMLAAGKTFACRTIPQRRVAWSPPLHLTAAGLALACGCQLLSARLLPRCGSRAADGASHGGEPE